MAAPGVANWQKQILTGVGAPVTPQNLKAFNAWAQAEGGTASNNPFNTTEPMPGATSYNSVGVRNYLNPQQGINATIQTLKGPIGNYGPILAALRAGNNPMAVAKAIAGSQWGTGSGVINVLGGQPLGGSASGMPAGQPAVPGASPKLPVMNMPPAPKLPSGGGTDFSGTILKSIMSGGDMNAMTNAIIGTATTAGNAALNTTPAQQFGAKGVQSATTPNGTQVEVQGKATPKDIAAVQLAEHFIGTPYSWGGGGPGGPSYGIGSGAQTKGFDCSSLIQFVWAKQGVNIPRTTYDQYQSGKPVAKSDLQPGDAVYFTGSDPMNGLPGHVGMYIGGGKFIEAPHTGADVRISSLAGRSDYVGARSFA